MASTFEVASDIGIDLFADFVYSIVCCVTVNTAALRDDRLSTIEQVAIIVFEERRGEQTC